MTVICVGGLTSCAGAVADVGTASGAQSGEQSAQAGYAQAAPDKGIAAEKWDDGVSQLAATDQETGPSGDAAAAKGDDSNLVVRFVDVGQGDCALVTCGGKSLLIDGGPSSASRKLYSVLRDLGIDSLDYLVMSHPDADHCGGVSGALEYARCQRSFCSVTENDTKTFKNIKQRLDAQGCAIEVPKAGDSFYLGSAKVTFVGPVETVADDTNNNSLVLRIDMGGYSWLFTGDAEKEEEKSLIAAGANLKATVLKVGHHGSASSTSAAFLKKVDPEYAVISVGADNSYGHPKQAVLNRIEKQGATLYRTDTDNSILFETNGETLSVSTTKRIEE